MNKYEVHVRGKDSTIARRFQFDILDEAIDNARKLCMETRCVTYVAKVIVECTPTVKTEILCLENHHQPYGYYE